MMRVNKEDYVDPREFHYIIGKFRTFFLERGYIEVYTQNRVTVLAACEQPENVVTYRLRGEKFPLPQTNQMHLEDLLLDHPDLGKIFTVSTSTRAEIDPLPGRHNTVFPLFEFEALGDAEGLPETLTALVRHLGYEGRITTVNYGKACKELGATTIGAKEEIELCRRYDGVVLLTGFPPSETFFNMRPGCKHDLLLPGVGEAVGSAPRSCDRAEMRRGFGGEYAESLYREFGKERVEKELNAYLGHKFLPRYGGGCGITRWLTWMRCAGLLPLPSRLPRVYPRRGRPAPRSQSLPTDSPEGGDSVVPRPHAD